MTHYKQKFATGRAGIEAQHRLQPLGGPLATNRMFELFPCCTCGHNNPTSFRVGCRGCEHTVCVTCGYAVHRDNCAPTWYYCHHCYEPERQSIVSNLQGNGWRQGRDELQSQWPTVSMAGAPDSAAAVEAAADATEAAFHAWWIAEGRDEMFLVRSNQPMVDHAMEDRLQNNNTFGYGQAAHDAFMASVGRTTGNAAGPSTSAGELAELVGLALLDGLRRPLRRKPWEEDTAPAPGSTAQSSGPTIPELFPGCTCAHNNPTSFWAGCRGCHHSNEPEREALVPNLQGNGTSWSSSAAADSLQWPTGSMAEAPDSFAAAGAAADATEAAFHAGYMAEGQDEMSSGPSDQPRVAHDMEDWMEDDNTFSYGQEARIMAIVDRMALVDRTAGNAAGPPTPATELDDALRRQIRRLAGWLAAQETGQEGTATSTGSTAQSSSPTIPPPKRRSISRGNRDIVSQSGTAAPIATIPSPTARTLSPDHGR